MTANDWPDLAQHLGGELRHLRVGASDVMKGFSGIAQAALAPGALPSLRSKRASPARSGAADCGGAICCTNQGRRPLAPTRQGRAATRKSALMGQLGGSFVRPDQSAVFGFRRVEGQPKRAGARRPRG